ncbi:hypothetical protein KY290_030861 [Solanum tuberosum]|uniref:Late blight resistance protein n=1 Tax=Solanum tuberosum TaxID=4113 RepID=A0ABQ7U8T0_SOLTU|nr:hypothetical protein KY290_030861 [Solanum tuberosum]
MQEVQGHEEYTQDKKETYDQVNEGAMVVADLKNEDVLPLAFQKDNQNEETDIDGEYMYKGNLNQTIATAAIQRDLSPTKIGKMKDHHTK